MTIILNFFLFGSNDFFSCSKADLIEGLFNAFSKDFFVNAGQEEKTISMPDLISVSYVF
jgi:hypothetical protein